MGIYDYLILSDENQWNTLWEKGKYVDSFKSIDCSRVLYAIDKFFVEVELCPIKEHIIAKSVFKAGPSLDKYVMGFDILFKD